jgi:predicted RNA methylase
MIVKNTTIQNKTKQNRLSNEHIVPAHYLTNKESSSFLKSLIGYKNMKDDVLFSIGSYLVRDNDNPSLKKFLSEYSYEKIDIPNIPENEFDLLGSVYQYLNSKKENLERGSFYTNHEIARDFVKDLDFNSNQTIIDPACGSGAFLFSSDASSNQIYGVDNDPIAVMIAKFNYFIKFPDAEYPNIFHDDFLVWYLNNIELDFDYVMGNPPYGATLNLSNIKSRYIKSGESFSYFVELGSKLLKENGILRYLLPESILNVKKHHDIRKFMLNHVNLTHIKKYETKFSGVMSDLYMLELDVSKNTDYLIFSNNISSTKVPKNVYRDLKNNVFTHFTSYDISIIEKVKKIQGHSLFNSIYGLGVVTGNNKEKLLDTPVDNSEPIYTGKEVFKYNLKTPTKHIIFDRDNLQQVASNSLYRAPKKLVYKTINKHIKVAIDESGSLTTNSANILIPNIVELDIYTIMGILNSQLYSYLNIKLFGGVNKIAKENLQALPIPKLSIEENNYIKELVMGIIENNSDDNILQNYINKNIFNLSDSEVSYINNF